VKFDLGDYTFKKHCFITAVLVLPLDQNTEQAFFSSCTPFFYLIFYLYFCDFFLSISKEINQTVNISQVIHLLSILQGHEYLIWLHFTLIMVQDN